MHARCSQYKLKLRELAQEVEEAESRTASVQEIADLRADEVCWHRHTLLSQCMKCATPDCASYMECCVNLSFTIDMGMVRHVYNVLVRHVLVQRLVQACAWHA